MKLPPVFGGETTPPFELVHAIFRKNFSDGWERDGAAVAVFHKGKLVCDLWGGYADTESARIWRKDTMTVVFSCTKALCSLAIAKLVDQGYMKYTDLVTEYWPEFGANGKEKITIRMLCSHMAGLAAVDRDITEDHLMDWRKMALIFEDQKPNWNLSSETYGYHGVTFGFLMDQIIRRVDPQHRSIGQYIQDEIVKCTGDEEFYLGLPEHLEYKVARMRRAGAGDLLGHVARNRHLGKPMMRIATKRVPDLTRRAFTQPDYILKHQFAGLQPFNNPEVHRLEIGAANGIGTARGLAQPFSALVNGDLLTQQTVNLIKKPIFVNAKDCILQFKVSAGHGFAYGPLPSSFALESPEISNHWLIGHPGSGGQNVKADFVNQISVAYISNSLKAGIGDYVRTFQRLHTAIYQCLDELSSPSPTSGTVMSIAEYTEEKRNKSPTKRHSQNRPSVYYESTDILQPMEKSPMSDNEQSPMSDQTSTDDSVTTI